MAILRKIGFMAVYQLRRLFITYSIGDQVKKFCRLSETFEAALTFKPHFSNLNF